MLKESWVRFGNLQHHGDRVLILAECDQRSCRVQAFGRRRGRKQGPQPVRRRLQPRRRLGGIAPTMSERPFDSRLQSGLSLSLDIGGIEDRADRFGSGDAHFLIGIAQSALNGRDGVIRFGKPELFDHRLAHRGFGMGEQLSQFFGDASGLFADAERFDGFRGQCGRRFGDQPQKRLVLFHTA